MLFALSSCIKKRYLSIYFCMTLQMDSKSPFSPLPMLFLLLRPPQP